VPRDAETAPPNPTRLKGSQPRRADPPGGRWLSRGCGRTSTGAGSGTTNGWWLKQGFTGSYPRVKVFVREARRRVAPELTGDDSPNGGLQRRFEVEPGRLTQVD
jgi:hypothetical protein